MFDTTSAEIVETREMLIDALHTGDVVTVNPWAYLGLVDEFMDFDLPLSGTEFRLWKLVREKCDHSTAILLDEIKKFGQVAPVYLKIDESKMEQGNGHHRLLAALILNAPLKVIVGAGDEPCKGGTWSRSTVESGEDWIVRAWELENMDEDDVALSPIQKFMDELESVLGSDKVDMFRANEWTW